MKNSPLTTILLGLLALSALWGVIAYMKYVSYSGDLQRLREQTAWLNNRGRNFQMLVNDTAEYSKTHPAMEQLLRSMTNAAPKTAAAPATTNK